MPLSNRCVANECRKLCMPTSFCMPAFFLADWNICWTVSLAQVFCEADHLWWLKPARLHRVSVTLLFIITPLLCALFYPDTVRLDCNVTIGPQLRNTFARLCQIVVTQEIPPASEWPYQLIAVILFTQNEKLQTTNYKPLNLPTYQPANICHLTSKLSFSLRKMQLLCRDRW